MNKKILYLMHVDWGWIKQRPHFIAEKLDKKYDVKIFYMVSRHRKVMTDNKSSVDTFPIITLPFKKIKLFYLLNLIIQRSLFYLIINLQRPEIIWITHPLMIDYIPRKYLSKYKIVYDCMDDILGFENSQEIKKLLERNERLLFKEAEIVFVSSEHLCGEIIKRGCDHSKTVIVRNGYNGELISTYRDEKRNNKESFKIAYIGTISSWIDFDLILYSLNQLDNIEYHFYGPVDSKVPNHEKIWFHGSIKHSELYETIKDCDCLIMPFKINNLILSVDPVKLNEYINFNKNIITVFYPEIDRFRHFVHFYNNKEEYIEIVRKLQKDNTIIYSNENRENFLLENNWDKRMKVIFNTLDNIQTEKE